MPAAAPPPSSKTSQAVDELSQQSFEGIYPAQKRQLQELVERLLDIVYWVRLM